MRLRFFNLSASSSTYSPSENTVGHSRRRLISCLRGYTANHKPNPIFNLRVPKTSRSKDKRYLHKVSGGTDLFIIFHTPAHQSESGYFPVLSTPDICAACAHTKIRPACWTHCHLSHPSPATTASEDEPATVNPHCRCSDI